MTDVYCCPMREHFLIGIIGEKKGQRPPTEAIDFMIDYEKLIIRIKYCAFCGTLIDWNKEPQRVPS